MPIYEYRCHSCDKKSAIFIRSIGASPKVTCQHCPSTEMERILSRVAHHKTIQQIHAESGPPSRHPTSNYYKDPRNIGRWAEQQFDKYGMDMPKELHDKIDAAREGSVEITEQP